MATKTLIDLFVFLMSFTYLILSETTTIVESIEKSDESLVSSSYVYSTRAASPSKDDDDGLLQSLTSRAYRRRVPGPRGYNSATKDI